MKTLTFVAGISVGALATVGVSVGAALFGINKLTDGALTEGFGVALSELKDIILDREKNK